MATTIQGGVLAHGAAVNGERRGGGGLRWLREPLYRRRFRRPFGEGNLYYGMYPDREQAQAAADALSSREIPASYDTEAAGRIYRNLVDTVRVSDFPLIHWLHRLIGDGARSVFDLGGNIGVSYYSFARYLDYPPDLRWTVHDLPHAMAAGRKRALTQDPGGRLGFADSERDADGRDVLVVTGALQYLPYSLPELLGALHAPPPHVLLNLTPMREDREFYTLQNLGIAICPYKVTSRPRLVDGMAALGYELRDRWTSTERHLEVPFHADARVDGYSGACFRRVAD